SIRIEVHKLGANIRVAITDTGIGIAENKQNMVFSSFNRLGVESTEIEGTGIGLVISKNLIELLGGKIGFSSIENKGSTFWFELPLAMHQASDASENAGGAALEGCAFQVLYIEDGLESLKAVAELFLHESQIKLLTSSTIEEGVKLLSKQSPDLILIEMTNREEECAQLLGFLQDTPSLAEIPVLAIMSDASDQARNKCLQIGFADIIVKPFDTQAINEALTHFLTRR
ncbi:MAG: ATP-binding protein, partial [Gammaproteobacteria bacterium]|nr:ATP-binding protein [Gammaproteobacteria bacterium]